MYDTITHKNHIVMADTDTIIFEILQNILVQSKADRAYIFEVDWDKRTHSCNYEVVQGEITSVEDMLKDLNIDESPWWTEHIINNRTIVINDTDHMLPEAANEKKILQSQGIKSLIVSPLLSKDGIWGYVGVDIVNRLHVWSDNDKSWFSSIANIISICTELKRSELKARK